MSTATLSRPVTHATEWVNAEPVRAHIANLRANGMGYRTIGELAGLGWQIVRKVVHGPCSGPRAGCKPNRIPRDKANRLLAITPAMSRTTFIPARGAQRRVKALVAAGWSIHRLVLRTGVQPMAFYRVLGAERVTIRQHLQIVAIFDELWAERPPANTPAEIRSIALARKHAQAHGWVTALAWDDIDRDAKPQPMQARLSARTIDEIAIELAIRGDHVKLTFAERQIAVPVLNSMNCTDPEIARRTSCSTRTIARDRERLGLPAVVDKGMAA